MFVVVGPVAVVVVGGGVRAGGAGVPPAVIQEGRGTVDSVPLEDAAWGLDVSREPESLSSAVSAGQVWKTGESARHAVLCRVFCCPPWVGFVRQILTIYVELRESLWLVFRTLRQENSRLFSAGRRRREVELSGVLLLLSVGHVTQAFTVHKASSTAVDSFHGKHSRVL